MAPILYRLRAELRSQWRTAAGLTIIVAVAGALVVTLAAGTVRTASAPDRYSTWWGDTYDATLEQAGGRARADEIESLPGVTAVEMASFVFGGLIPDGGEAPLDALVFAGSAEALGERLVDGRMASASEPGEFVASRSFADRTGAELGDRFQLITINQAQSVEHGFEVDEPTGPTVTATLVGVMDGAGELQDGYAIVVFPASLLDVGDIGIAASAGVVALESGSTLDDLRAELDTLPGGEAFGVAAWKPVPGDVRSAVSTQAQGLVVVVSIVTLAALAVVGQLLSRQVRLAESQRMAMRSLGLGPTQLAVDSVARAATSVAAGALAAGVASFLLSGLFPRGFVTRIEPHPGLRFEPLVHLLGPVLIVVVLSAWLLLIALAGDRQREPSGEVGYVERVALWIRSSAAATGVRFAFSRPPGRSSSAWAPVAGLVIVLTVLVGALTFGRNLDRLIDEPARHGVNFDAGIGQGGDVVPEDALAVLEADPDVAAVTLYGTVFAAVGSVSLDVTGMEPIKGDLRPAVLTGRLPAVDDEIALGRAAARELGVGIGDDLALKGSTGREVFRVTGLAVITSLDGGDGMGEGGVVTHEGLLRIEPAKTLGTAGVRFRPGAPAGTAERLSEEAGVGLGQGDPPGTIVNLARVRSIPYMVVAALGLLAVLSLAHQLLLSAQRRRRDLAVLRAIGAGPRWVSSAVHWQASVLGLVVLAIAVPLGIAAGQVLTRTFVQRLGAPDDLAVPFGWLAMLLVAVALLGNAVAAVPAFRARHDRPAEVLADT